MHGCSALTLLPRIAVLVQEAMLPCCAEEPLLKMAASLAPLAAVLVAEGLLDAAVRAALAAPLDATAQNLAVLAEGVIMALLQEAANVAAGAEAEAADVGMAAAVAGAAAVARQALGGSSDGHMHHSLQSASAWLPPARQLATALLAWWRRPEEQQAAALELAQAAAARSCAYLRCANLRGEGGPAAGQGVGSQRCRCAGERWSSMLRQSCA